MAGEHDRALDALVTLIEGGHLAGDYDLPRLAAEAGAALGAGIAVYLSDLRQQVLVPLDGDRQPQAIESTLAGRAFRLIEAVPAEDPAEPRLWVPLLDGVERLGVLDVVLPPGTDLADPGLRRRLRWVASLLGHLVGVKTVYGDTLLATRRRQRMSVAGELVRAMLPPATFGVDSLAGSAVVEPCYDVGGDAYDYAVDPGVLRFAVVDAMGHSLRAGLMSTTAIAAYRAGRRAGESLYGVTRLVDETLAEQFGVERFATGLLAELSLETGRLRYVNAGHPPPLLLRAGKVVKALEAGRRLPLGFDVAEATVGEEFLEPGDSLLVYTDGVVEARDEAGEFFGLARLVDFLERQAASRQPAPETLRRLVHAVVEHQAGRLQDDATLFLLEWSPAAPERLGVR